MATTAEIAARLAELKISTGTHEHAATWIRAAIRELETALGWATHLDRIEAANPGHESTERDNAARWITDHLERGERIAHEAGAHLPEPTTLRCLCRRHPGYACPVHTEHPAHALRVRLADLLDGEPRVGIELSVDRTAVLARVRHDVDLTPWHTALGIAPGRMRGEIDGVTTRLAIKSSDHWLAPLH